MFKHFIPATLFVALTSSFAFAKDTLYIVNSGSTGGSYNAQLTAWMSDLDDYYDVTYVQAKGCAKASAVINKISADPSNQVITIYSSAWDQKSDACSTIYPTEDNFFFNTYKSGLIFKRNDSDATILTDGVTIGFNGTNNRVLEGIDNNFNTVRYENSKGVTLAVLNGEVELGLINSASEFWKNEDKLSGLVMLGPDSWEDMPSISTIGGTVSSGWDNYVYWGPDRDKLLSLMQNIAKDQSSSIYAWTNKNKAYWSNIEADSLSSLSNFQSEYPR